jgi:hypothetical protein
MSFVPIVRESWSKQMWLDYRNGAIAIAVVASAVVFLRQMPIASPMLPAPKNRVQAFAHRALATSLPPSHLTSASSSERRDRGSSH